MRTFTALYFELNGYINLSFCQSNASSGLKYVSFFSFITVTSCKLITICKRHSQGYSNVRGYCGQPLTKIANSKVSLKMAGVLLLSESWWGGRNTYPWILKSSSAFSAKWCCERNDLVCILVWKWMMDIGRITSFEAMAEWCVTTLNCNQSEHKLAIKVLTDMYVEFVDLFWDFLGLNTKASKTVNIIFECCVYLKRPHRMAFKILVRVLWAKLSKILS